MKKGLIFFGHGAKDMQWREPFDKLAKLWSERHPNVHVSVSFLERMDPNLTDAVGKLHSLGVQEIKVIPVFFGQGGHLREDFPLLLNAAQESYPEIRLSATPAVGESLDVLNAILGFAETNMA